MWIRNNLFWIREFVEFRIRILVYVFSIFEKLKKRIVINLITCSKALASDLVRYAIFSIRIDR